jgi:2,3-diketo-5-methylthio-1-phosphopentane phosphatase/methylthioribulose-1-phosphate dehydratase
MSSPANRSQGKAVVVRALLLDIEGTTSSLEFVRDVLFPYAREHLRRFIEGRRGDPQIEARLHEVAQLARAEGAPGGDPVTQLERWMAQDRKLTPLKALQGLLWDEAFRREEFRAHVYRDVPPALARMRELGLSLYVYSSGSVRAQQAFFRHSQAGDLTPLIDGWFDTEIGSKRDSASYRAIAAATGLSAPELLFLSDSREELDAARAAGLVTIGLLRGPLALGAHPAVTRFDDLPPGLFASARAAASDPPSPDPTAPDPTAPDPTAPALTAPDLTAPDLTAARAQVVALAHHHHARGWAAATSGNFSVRVSPERFLITASGVDKGQLGTGDVLLVSLDGAPLEAGTPSAESPLHAALYRSARDIGAVIHTHSPAATVLSRQHAAEGALRLTGYEMSKALRAATDGTLAELVLPILPNLQDTRALAPIASERVAALAAPAYLVEGHGLTTWGKDPSQARRHAEAIEHMLQSELEERRYAARAPRPS